MAAGDPRIAGARPPQAEPRVRTAEAPYGAGREALAAAATAHARTHTRTHHCSCSPTEARARPALSRWSGNAGSLTRCLLQAAAREVRAPGDSGVVPWADGGPDL